MCAIRRHSSESVPVKYFRDHDMQLQGIIPEVGNRAMRECKILQIFVLFFAFVMSLKVRMFCI